MTTDAREEHAEVGRDARPERAAAAIRETGAEVQHRQVGQALAALEAAGGLTDGQRAVIERFADRLVDRLLAPPTASLQAAATDADHAEVTVALELFDARADTEGDDE
ncbi:hypothetical protein [Halosegnis sp.]|uniref:hypothetical protein n=1 Tax=Halosegnis sp. TaxID=2864959 RepID=UPI0035D40DEC